MQVCCVVYVHVWERHYGSVVGLEGGEKGMGGEGGEPIVEAKLQKFRQPYKLIRRLVSVALLQHAFSGNSTRISHERNSAYRGVGNIV